LSGFMTGIAKQGWWSLAFLPVIWRTGAFKQQGHRRVLYQHL